MKAASYAQIEFFSEDEALLDSFSPFETATPAFMSVLCIAGALI